MSVLNLSVPEAGVFLFVTEYKQIFFEVKLNAIEAVNPKKKVIIPTLFWTRQNSLTFPNNDDSDELLKDILEVKIKRRGR